MDSTIVVGETLDELAGEAGLRDPIAAITKRAMDGERDFKAALRERVAMHAGLSALAVERTLSGLQLTSGAKTLVACMRRHGAFTVLVSGGFEAFTSRVREMAGFDAAMGNRLEINHGCLTGRVIAPILDRNAKATTLRRRAESHGVALAATLAVGDGANDLDMLATAGLGIAFRAKPVAAERAHARIDHADLTALLYVQGYRAAEIEQD